ncbi:hypothetical protein QBC43DRAFT_288258 [Cladorrhinum sp. PSN259]|nr:hypothetical protein QBC43DRAFT_288258 [Cladorrhinum sp. PSN259]
MPPKRGTKEKPYDNGISPSQRETWFMHTILGHIRGNLNQLIDWNGVRRDMGYANTETTKVRWGQVRKKLMLDRIAAGDFAVEGSSDDNRGNDANDGDDDDDGDGDDSKDNHNSGRSDPALGGGDRGVTAKNKRKKFTTSAGVKKRSGGSTPRKTSRSAYLSAYVAIDSDDDEEADEKPKVVRSTSGQTLIDLSNEDDDDDDAAIQSQFRQEISHGHSGSHVGGRTPVTPEVMSGYTGFDPIQARRAATAIPTTAANSWSSNLTPSARLVAVNRSFTPSFTPSPAAAKRPGSPTFAGRSPSNSNNNEHASDSGGTSIFRGPLRSLGSGITNWYGGTDSSGHRLSSGTEALTPAARRVTSGGQTSAGSHTMTPGTSASTDSSPRMPLDHTLSAHRVMSSPTTTARRRTPSTTTLPASLATNITTPSTNTGTRSPLNDTQTSSSPNTFSIFGNGSGSGTTSSQAVDTNTQTSTNTGQDWNVNYRGPGLLPDGSIDLWSIPEHPSARKAREAASTRDNHGDIDEEDQDLEIGGGAALVVETQAAYGWAAAAMAAHATAAASAVEDGQDTREYDTLDTNMRDADENGGHGSSYFDDVNGWSAAEPAEPASLRR